jgi:hypothetical protein
MAVRWAQTTPNTPPPVLSLYDHSSQDLSLENTSGRKERSSTEGRVFVHQRTLARMCGGSGTPEIWVARQRDQEMRKEENGKEKKNEKEKEMEREEKMENEENGVKEDEEIVEEKKMRDSGKNLQSACRWEKLPSSPFCDLRPLMKTRSLVSQELTLLKEIQKILLQTGVIFIYLLSSFH